MFNFTPESTINLEPGIYDKNGKKLCDIKDSEDFLFLSHKEAYFYKAMPSQKISETEFNGITDIEIFDIRGTLAKVCPEFRYCDKLREVYLPNSMEDFRTLPTFIQTPNIEFIYVEDDNVNYRSHNGMIYDANYIHLYYCPPKNKNLELKNTTKIIHQIAFRGVKTEQLVIPEGVEHLSDNAFRHLTATRLFLPNSLVTTDQMKLSYDDIDFIYYHGDDKSIHFFYKGYFPEKFNQELDIDNLKDLSMTEYNEIFKLAYGDER